MCSFQGTILTLSIRLNGDGEIRTHDPLLARQVLSQLSYTPKSLFLSIANILFLPEYRINHKTMGLSGLEPPTSRLSGVRSNQLSYKPILLWQPPTLPYRLQYSTLGRSSLNRRVRDGYGCVP